MAPLGNVWVPFTDGMNARQTGEHCPWIPGARGPRHEALSPSVSPTLDEGGRSTRSRAQELWGRAERAPLTAPASPGLTFPKAAAPPAHLLGAGCRTSRPGRKPCTRGCWWPAEALGGPDRCPRHLLGWAWPVWESCEA